jgi:hypothetical protein
MKSVWNEIRENISKHGLRHRLENSVLPSEQNENSGWTSAGRTLFEMVRLSAGIDEQDMDYADVSFWNWLELRRSFIDIWRDLDLAATEKTGRTTLASAWAHESSTSFSEVLEIIDRAEEIRPGLEATKAIKRIEAPFIVNAGKVEAAIINTCAVICKQEDSSYGAIFSELIKNCEKDEETLVYLDELVNKRKTEISVTDRTSMIPRELGRAKSKMRNQSDEFTLTFVEFLKLIEPKENFEQLSDKLLRSRLVQIAPEESASFIRKIQLLDETKQ